MSKRTVRIEAVNADGVEAQFRKDWIIRANFTLNEANEVECSGYIGAMRGTPFGASECYPVAIRADGKVDFGSAFVPDAETLKENPKADRYGQTNLLRKKIIVGETFNLTEDDEENTYRIEKVTELT